MQQYDDYDEFKRKLGHDEEEYNSMTSFEKNISPFIGKENLVVKEGPLLDIESFIDETLTSGSSVLVLDGYTSLEVQVILNQLSQCEHFKNQLAHLEISNTKLIQNTYGQPDLERLQAGEDIGFLPTPDSMSQFTNLQHLILRGNGYDSFGGDWSKISLSALIIECSGMLTLPEDFNVSKLTYLELNDAYDVVPDNEKKFFKSLKSLKELHLTNNTNICHSVSEFLVNMGTYNLNNLTHLNLNGSSIEDIYVEQFPRNLKHIDMSRCEGLSGSEYYKGQYISEHFSGLTKLQYLEKLCVDPEVTLPDSLESKRVSGTYNDPDINVSEKM